MKNLAILLTFTLILAVSCSKSDSNDPSNAICKLQKSTETVNGATLSTYYQYDAAGKIDLVWEQTGKSDTAHSRKYYYTDVLFSYSVGKDINGSHDTVWYTYDDSKRITQTLKKNFNSGNILTVVTRYSYNSANLAVMSVATSTLDQVNFTIDSILYTYSGSNVSGYTEYTKVGNNAWTTYRVKFGYDDKRNFMNTTGEPPVTYHYWAVNNLNQYFNPDSANAFMTYNFSNYTESQLPQNYSVTFRPEQPTTVFSGSMNYQCE